MANEAGQQAGRAIETVREAARSAAQTARETTSAAGERLREAASDLRGRLPEGIAEAAERARGGIEETFSQLREADLESMREGAMDWIRRRPVEAVLIGLGLGIVIGGMLARRRDTHAGDLTERHHGGGVLGRAAETGRRLAERAARQ